MRVFSLQMPQGTHTKDWESPKKVSFMVQNWGRGTAIQESPQGPFSTSHRTKALIYVGESGGAQGVGGGRATNTITLVALEKIQDEGGGQTLYTWGGAELGSGPTGTEQAAALRHQCL